MKKYKLKNQTYAEAFGVLFGIKHLLNIEFTEGHRWHKVALEHGVMHWFEEVDEFANLPKSVKEIEGRKWYIGTFGQIKEGGGVVNKDVNNLSSKERAEAFLALMQLVELRDAWNNSVDQEWDSDEAAYVLVRYSSMIKRGEFARYTPVLRFKTVELRNRFHEQFRDLIETAKELI